MERVRAAAAYARGNGCDFWDSWGKRDTARIGPTCPIGTIVAYPSVRHLPTRLFRSGARLAKRGLRHAALGPFAPFKLGRGQR